MATDIYNDGTYAAKNPSWHSQDSEWKAKHLFSLIDASVLAGMKEISIVEIGCGYGGVLAGLSRRIQASGLVCKATGYDISSIALSEASRRHPTIQFIQGDFLKTNERYDLIVVADLLEHLECPQSILAHMKRCSRWVLVHLPLDEHLYGKLIRFGYYYEFLKADRGHIHYFTRWTGLKLLRDAELRILQWKYTPWGTELYKPGGGRSAPVVKFFRSIGIMVWPDLTVRVLGGASLACFCST